MNEKKMMKRRKKYQTNTVEIDLILAKVPASKLDKSKELNLKQIKINEHKTIYFNFFFDLLEKNKIKISFCFSCFFK